MNKLKYITTLFLILFYLFFLSCNKADKNYNQSEENIENAVEQKDSLEVITVQCFPSFILNSMFILDLSKEKLIFQHIGAKGYLRFSPPPEKTDTIYAPENMYISLSKEAISFFRDSILYEQEDFSDKMVLAHDGISNYLAFYYGNGEVKAVDISNFQTKNHLKLIFKLIDIGISNSSDSITSEYLNNLKRYYPRR